MKAKELSLKEKIGHIDDNKIINELNQKEKRIKKLVE